jgi:Domain of unknown function (DUF4352)
MHLVRLLVSLALIFTVALLISCGSAGGNSIVPNYSMGERAQAGQLIYTVFENRWMPQLGSGTTARIPANRFFLLRLSIVNSGSNEAIAPALTLIDDNGQRYPELSDGEGVPQWTGYLRRLKSADTLTGNIVFDVAARHYKLEVTDETDEKKALIDIPLSFNTEQVPFPPGDGGPQGALPIPVPVAPK